MKPIAAANNHVQPGRRASTDADDDERARLFDDAASATGTQIVSNNGNDGHKPRRP